MVEFYTEVTLAGRSYARCAAAEGKPPFKTLKKNVGSREPWRGGKASRGGCSLSRTLPTHKVTANQTSNLRPRTLLALNPVTHLLGSRAHTRRSALSPRTSGVRRPKRFPATVRRAILETLFPLRFGAVGCPELQLPDTLAARLPGLVAHHPFPRRGILRSVSPPTRPQWRVPLRSMGESHRTAHT